MKTLYDPTKHLKIEMRFKNGPLMQLMELHHLSARKLAKELGVSYIQLLEFINLKRSPCLKHPDADGHIFSKTAVKIAKYFHLSPTDIFPPETWKEVEKNEFSFYFSATKKKDVFLDKDERWLLTFCLQQLTDREREVITKIFGIGCEPETIDHIARENDVSTYRVKAVASRALRRLRHPSRLGRFREVFDALCSEQSERGRRPAMRIGR